MYKVLFVGDIHATPEELDDCDQLRWLVERTALAEQVDCVVLLGDSYHTHNIIRSEVMAFYRAWFKDWKKHPWETVALVGNHDYAGEGRPEHAMLIHEDQVTVVDAPTVRGPLLLMPYYSNREKFVEDASFHPGKVLVCHQTLYGSRYENGFMAEDGVDPADLPQTRVISGHIHTPQSFGKVTYIGAPRWRSLSDANEERAVWLYTFEDDGKLLGKAPVDTGTACRQIHYLVETPDGPLLPADVDQRHDWRVDVHGPADFIEQRKAILKGMGAKYRTFCTDRVEKRVRESEGIGSAFRSFLTHYTPRHGTRAEVLAALAKERLDV